MEPQTPEIEQPLFEDTPRTQNQRSNSQNACVRGERRKASKITDFEKNILELENKKLSVLIDKGSSQKEADIDDDMHFPQSLVPFFRRLNPPRKLVIRSEIQNLLIQQLINETPTTSGVSNNGTSLTECSTDIPNYFTYFCRV